MQEAASQIGIIGIFAIVLGAFCLGAVVVAASMAVGYWAGRNSSERPFRSAKNPAKPQEKQREAIGEPEGDFYREAAFGEDTEPVSTIMRQ